MKQFVVRTAPSADARQHDVLRINEEAPGCAPSSGFPAWGGGIAVGSSARTHRRLRHRQRSAAISALVVLRVPADGAVGGGRRRIWRRPVEGLASAAIGAVQLEDLFALCKYQPIAAYAHPRKMARKSMLLRQALCFIRQRRPWPSTRPAAPVLD